MQTFVDQNNLYRRVFDRVSRATGRIKAVGLLTVLLGLAGCGRDSGQPTPQSAPPATQPTAAPIAETNDDQQPKTATDKSATNQQSFTPNPAAQSASLPATRPRQPEPDFRASDDRPVHDVDSLRKRGINKFESKRCLLFTDIDSDIAKTLPPFVDALYTELVNYFGELPANREGTDFQVTGYIMRDQDTFKAAGLLPDNLPSFEHGRHSGYEFWMNEQQWDYYRRHLMLHEATHCFMTACVKQQHLAPPTWYMEGMAEWFATHRVRDGKIETAVMQNTDNGYEGFNRVRIVRDAVKSGSTLSFDRLRALTSGEFIETEHYAQSWAICQLMTRNPNYQERFHQLGQIRSYAEFTNTH